MDKIKICKKCNTVESENCKFVKNRSVCNICRYKSRVNDQYKLYFKEYYQKNKDEILKQKSNNYKIKKETNLSLIL